MAEFEAGEVVVPVVPDAADFAKKLKKQLLGGAYEIGQSLGKEINRGIQDSLKDVYAPLREETQKQRSKAPQDGAEVGGAFAKGFKARVAAALRDLPKANIDADSTAAQTQVQAVRTALESLSQKTIGIDVDAGSAEAELAGIIEQLRQVDGDTATVDIQADVAKALADLGVTEAEVDRVDGRTARAKVDVDVAGALSAIATVSTALAAVAAIPVGASIGAGLLALSGPLAAAGAGFGGLAAIALPAVKQISEALKEQDKATKEAANSARDSSGATKTAAEVAAQAASQALALAQGEQRVVDAKKAAKQAEQDLTQAREDAKRAMEDLTRSVKDAALAEEDAAVSVEEARQRLNETLADPEATDLEKKRAELNYREAVSRLEDQQARTKRLKEDQAAADKAGIEGSKQVTAAKDRLAQANQRVKDAEAQLKVLRLQQAAAAAREAAASAQAAKSTGTLATKFSELSPAAKTAAKQFQAFMKAYGAWQRQLDPLVLPLIGRGLKIVQQLFKPMTPLIKNAAVAFGGLLDSASKALTQPFWTDFFTQLSDWVPTAVGNLGRAFGNIIKGIVGVIKAFLPFTGEITGGLDTITAKFAAWGSSLGDSSGFKSFIDYAKTNAPQVIATIKNVAAAIGNIVSALGPLAAGNGVTLLSGLNLLATLTKDMSPGQIQAIAAAILAITAAAKTLKVVSTVVNGVKVGFQAASSVIRGAKAVWSGIGTAASKAASVAKTSATAIAGAARTAGSAAAKGASAAWTGITAAASKAGTAAKVAGTAILNAGRTAAIAAVNLGRVAFQYAAIGVQAALSATKTLLAAAAQKAVAIATGVWAAAQRVLNLVLAANPIGLIITAIGLLVAGLIYAWNNSETFRTIVTAAWESIKAVVVAAWTNYIQPALTALWQFITNTLAPAALWLWNNVIVPAWNGISAAVQYAWNNVIKPALQALWNFFVTTLAPKILWFHTTIVQPVFSKVGQVIKFTWESIIKPALNALWTFITTTLAPKVLWFHQNVVQPVFTKVGQIISDAWTKVIKPTFDFLVKAVTQDIPNGFKAGVDLIGKFWDKVKDVAKAPVKFIVDIVYNGGIVKIWNAVADILGMKDKKLQPLAFAKGGVYPGYTPGKDIGFAAVSGGEAIMRPEWTRAVGEDYVHKMNAAARSGGVGGVARALGVAGDPGGFAGAFAGGGIVGEIKDLLAGGLKVGAEQFLNPLLDQASKAMGDSQWAKLLVGVPKAMVANVIKWIGDNDTGGDGGKALAYAKAQLGKPYKWGATGPDAFDCSGLTMRAWQAAGVGDIPRVSQDQMAWVHPVDKPQPGDLGFPHSGHVWMYSNPVSKIVEAPYTGAKVREVAARAAQVMGRPPSLFDNGGQLVPGTSLVHNGTGRPEKVLTDQQWKAIASGPARGGDGALLHIDDFHATPEQSPMAIAKDLRYLLGSQVGLRGK